MIKHLYMSTACSHGRHTDCRVTCKFCREQCVCLCHIEDKPTDDQFHNAAHGHLQHRYPERRAA